MDLRAAEVPQVTEDHGVRECISNAVWLLGNSRWMALAIDLLPFENGEG